MIFLNVEVKSSWSKLYTPFAGWDGSSIGLIWAAMIVSIFFYIVMGTYLENILPSNYGARKPIFYPFYVSFSKTKKQIRNHTKSKVSSVKFCVNILKKYRTTLFTQSSILNTPNFNMSPNNNPDSTVANAEEDSQTILRKDYQEILKKNGITHEISEVLITCPDLKGEHMGSLIELVETKFENGSPSQHFFVKKLLPMQPGQSEMMVQMVKVNSK